MIDRVNKHSCMREKENNPKERKKKRHQSKYKRKENLADNFPH